MEEFFVDRGVDAALKEHILGLPQTTQAALEELIRNLNPSANTVREYLRLAEECALRDGKNIADYLSNPTIRDIFAAKRSKKEKQKLIRQDLEAQRFPQRQWLLEEIERLKKEIIKHFGIEVQIPPELEGLKLGFSFAAQSREEAERYAGKIKELAESNELKQIYALLLGEFDEIEK